MSSTVSYDSSRLSSQTTTDPSQTTGQPSQTAPLWTPLPGPQLLALESQADELFYGGAAGGGKTDLLLGLSITQHRTSIIFRREYKQLRGIRRRSREIIGLTGRFNGSDDIWRLGDREIEFGAMEHEDDKDKFQGQPHDLIGFDELPHFTESQYRFVIGWNRSTVPGQRSRVVGAGNPPTDADGEWVIQYWAPWLDDQHRNPAEPGELRWFAVIDGKDVEREDGSSFLWKGETIYPRSRTFIPARLGDNPMLAGTGYIATLQGLPEPLRSQMLYGDFTVGLQDDEWQVIPTAWVRAAQARWTPTPPTPIPDQHGIDVAQGGADNTVDVRRHVDWFSEPDVIPGASMPDAKHNADNVERVMADGGVAYIDADGIGSSTYFLARATLGKRVQPYQGSAPTTWMDKAKVLAFVNTRAAAWWALREALDPSNGRQIALPPSRDLRVELCAPRWTKQSNGVKIEKKDEVKERLGRSPDLADAVVMANWDDRNPLHGVLARATTATPVQPPDIRQNLPTLNGTLLPEQRPRLRLTRGR